MRPTEDTLTLPCILNDQEKIEYGLQQAEALQKMEEAENKKKEFDSQIKADIEKYEARAHEIGHKLTSGKEYREVECEIVYDFKNKTRAWIRKDTKEEAKNDIIPEEMLQEEIPLDSDKKKENKKAKK
jgi:hypothetical protein